MYPLYKDIREGLGTPIWIDEYGVPRYREFAPVDAARIYGDWVVLMQVECQSCGKIFHCSNSLATHSYFTKYMRDDLEKSFAKRHDPEFVLPLLIFWGDAPWHTHGGHQARFDGQCAGTTMSSDVLSVRAWHKFDAGWEEVEVPIPVMKDLGLRFWEETI